jgi:hypothetical protein
MLPVGQMRPAKILQVQVEVEVEAAGRTQPARIRLKQELAVVVAVVVEQTRLERTVVAAGVVAEEQEAQTGRQHRQQQRDPS